MGVAVPLATNLYVFHLQDHFYKQIEHQLTILIMRTGAGLHIWCPGVLSEWVWTAALKGGRRRILARLYWSLTCVSRLVRAVPRMPTRSSKP